MKFRIGMALHTSAFAQQIHLKVLNLYSAILFSSLITGTGSNCSIDSYWVLIISVLLRPWPRFGANSFSIGARETK